MVWHVRSGCYIEKPLFVCCKHGSSEIGHVSIPYRKQIRPSPSNTMTTEAKKVVLLFTEPICLSACLHTRFSYFLPAPVIKKKKIQNGFVVNIKKGICQIDFRVRIRCSAYFDPVAISLSAISSSCAV